ncbi:long-chain fatty acid--CoA ligase [Leucobacter sp. BZR 635]
MSTPPPVAPGTLREAATSPLVDISGIHNVTDLLAARCAKAPDHIAFETRAPGADLTDPWRQISTRAFASEVEAAARGLIASGVTAGDTVMIVAGTQYLWAVADHAALYSGAVVVPAYDTAPESQLAAILTDARPVAAFVGTPALARRIATAAAAAGAPVPTLWVFEPGSGAGAARVGLPMSELATRGTHVTPEDLERRRLTASLDDVATVVYTSGTTGSPKGARITHRNLVGQVLNTAAAYREVVRETGNTILFLPLTHVLGRALQLICVANGMRVAHLANPQEVVRALAVLKPTFLVVVPRVLERIQGAAAASAREKKLSRVWDAAVRTAERWGSFLEERDAADPGTAARAPLGLRARHALFDRLFYRRLRTVMGNRIEYLLSGAATLQPELARFFRGIGVPIIEGYGLTETTAPLTGGRPGALAAGSVGTPLPGNRVRIADTGEVLASGIGVFAGYTDPERNAGAFVDGFFRTGDLGSLSADGTLTLHGRMNHVIVTSTGRTVSPEPWEQAVEAHPLVAHAVLLGTDRPFLTAALVLDTEAATEWFRRRGETPPAELSSPGIAVLADARLTAELSTAITAANATVPPSERAQYSRLVTIGADRADGFITPTMKLKRQALLDALRPTIDELYG